MRKYINTDVPQSRPGERAEPHNAAPIIDPSVAPHRPKNILSLKVWAGLIAVGTLLLSMLLISQRSYAQGSSNNSQFFHSRLSLQPEANKIRHRLGNRFVGTGREKTILNGFLTVGADRRHVQITRTQDDTGEQVSISFGGPGPDFSWSAASGAALGAAAATGNDRALVERIVMDSPDQFVLAQMRGASYYVVARSVRPKEVGADPGYAGPLWDIVRVAEAEGSDATSVQSRWRLYYINTRTGLIDKVATSDQDGPIVAEFSGWAKNGDEQDPTLIRWMRGGQLVMELSLNNIGHGPKQ